MTVKDLKNRLQYLTDNNILNDDDAVFLCPVGTRGLILYDLIHIDEVKFKGTRQKIGKIFMLFEDK